jgi:hypothetical protein
MPQVSLYVRQTGTARLRGVVEAADQLLASQIEGTIAARSLWADAAATSASLATGVNVTTVNLGAAGSTVTIPGSLTVNGTTTTLNTTNLTVSDTVIILADGAAVGDEAGIAFERGATGDDAMLLWNEVNSRFELGFFDTVGGTSAPSGTLAAKAALAVGSLLMDTITLDVANQDVVLSRGAAGVLKVADAMNVGTTTLAVAAGDFAAGDPNQNLFYDQSANKLNWTGNSGIWNMGIHYNTGLGTLQVTGSHTGFQAGKFLLTTEAIYNIQFGTSGYWYLGYDTAQTNGSAMLTFPSWGNMSLIVQGATGDYGHAFATTPTLILHSDTAPASATDEWVSLTHNVTDAVLAVGSGSLLLPSSVHLNGKTTALSSSAAGLLVLSDSSAAGDARIQFYNAAASDSVLLGYGGVGSILKISDPALASDSELHITDAAGNVDAKIKINNNAIQLDGINGVVLTPNGSLNNSWEVNGSGHLAPLNNASTLNVGSPTREIANVYIGTGGIHLGTAQEAVLSAGAVGVLQVGDSTTLGQVHILDAAGNPDVKIYEAWAGNAVFEGKAGILLAVNGSNRYDVLTGSLSPSSAAGSTLGTITKEWGDIFTSGSLQIGAGQEVSVNQGAGTPEAAVTANVGSIFLRNDGGTGSSLYTKTSGAGNTGWEVVGAGVGASLTETFTNNTGVAWVEGDLIAPHTTASEGVLADASADTNVGLAMGFVTSAGVADATSGEICTVRGQKVVARFDAGLTLTNGELVFMSETAGRVTDTAPVTAGSVVQQVGWITDVLSYDGALNLTAEIMFMDGSRFTN